MQPQCTGKQAVPKADLDNIIRRCAAGNRNPGNAIRPDVYITLCVNPHRRLARCAGRSVNPYDFAHGNRQHLKRVVVADIFFGCIGYVRNIRQRFDPGTVQNTTPGQSFMVKRDVFIAVRNHFFQFLQLQRLYLSARHGFYFLLKKQKKHFLP